MKPGPHELAQQHPVQGVSQFNLVMHQMMLCPAKWVQSDKSVGADFRYAVEFSKYGRAPLEVSRPPPGQPDLRYRLGSTTPNRLCPAVPDSHRDARVTASALTDVFAGVCPWAVQLPETFRSGRCAVPLGAWTKLRGHCGSRQTRRSSRVSVINGLNRCRWAGRIGAGQVRPAQGSHSDAVHIKPSRVRSRPQAPVPPGLRRLGWDAEPGPLRAD
jgi:hypothetical protein